MHKSKHRSMKGYKKSRKSHYRYGGKKYKMTMKSKMTMRGKDKKTKNNMAKKCRNMMEMRRNMSRMRHLQ